VSGEVADIDLVTSQKGQSNQQARPASREQQQIHLPLTQPRLTIHCADTGAEMMNMQASRHASRGARRLVAVVSVLMSLAAAPACVLRAVPKPPGPTQPPVTLPPSLRRNCAGRPSVCGYPDATNTGVPAGTVLTAVPAQARAGPGWHWDSRGWLVVDANGAVLDHVSVTSGIVVAASNVTVKRSRVAIDTRHQTAANHSSQGIKVNNGSANTTIVDSEIYGSGTGQDRLEAGIQCQYDVFTCKVQRVDIWHTTSGVQANGGLVQDSYIHDFGFYDWGSAGGPDHLNGITSNAHGGLTVKHNTILNQFGQTDAVSLFEDFGGQANNLIDDNLLAGGGYCIYGGDGGHGATAYIRITNNRISRKYFPRGGQWGWISHFTNGQNGNVSSGNRWDEDNQPLS
jgi:hypothetical protein